MSGTLSRRQASIFACLADTVLAPAPPLPPVGETATVASFDRWLSAFSPIARGGFGALLTGLELAPRLLSRRRLPWHALAPAERLRWLRLLETTLPYGGAIGDAIRAGAGASYYGDPAVAATVGYVRPEAR